MATPTHYPQSIRIAHWSVVILIIFQFLTGDGMSDAFRDETSWRDTQLGTAAVHAFLGLCILAFMIWRLVVRLRSDVPPPPDTEPAFLQKISRAVHYTFYALLIGMPVAGAAALLTESRTIGALHGWAALLLFLLAVAHVAGAIWHIFKKDGVFRRIAGGREGTGT